MAKSKKTKAAPKPRHLKAAKARPAKKSGPPAKPAARKVAHPPKPAPAKTAPKAPEPKATPAKPPNPKPVPPAKPKAAAPKAAETKAAPAKPLSKADALRQRILERRTAKPIAFTLDEVREIAKTVTKKTDPQQVPDGKSVDSNGKPRNHADEVDSRLKKAAQPNYVKPASLTDILGYNPTKQVVPGQLDLQSVDPKYHRFYQLLVELRDHVLSGLSTHTEETLKRSTKEDSGDLSGYGQHMADAGTDTFDRDFALSLVSNEQEALAEIEAAIERIRRGTYGVCELTGKPIARDRLMAVPFARYSVESQAEVERVKRRSASRGGLFGEIAGEESGKIEEEPEE